MRFWLEPGIVMQLHPDCELSRLLYCVGYEDIERSTVGAALRAGDVFIDVGANVGVFSLIAGDRVGPTGHVFAFEPSPRTHARLVDNVALNGLQNVEPLQLALSSSGEPLQLAVSEGAWSAWDTPGTPYMGDGFRRVEVPSLTLDAFVEARGLSGRVTFMKIDVEGWERQVLLGGQATLARSDAPHLLIEFTELAARNAGCSCEALWDCARALGYDLYLPGSLARLSALPSIGESRNLLATKRLPELMLRLSGEVA